jgi:hypothetical protein
VKEKMANMLTKTSVSGSACIPASDSTLKGTCYTSSECLNKGGTSGGNCAAGEGSILKTMSMGKMSLTMPGPML